MHKLPPFLLSPRPWRWLTRRLLCTMGRKEKSTQKPWSLSRFQSNSIFLNKRETSTSFYCVSLLIRDDSWRENSLLTGSKRFISKRSSQTTTVVRKIPFVKNYGKNQISEVYYSQLIIGFSISVFNHSYNNFINYINCNA